MHFTGNVYRPPFESRSLLLQVSAGCSHNRCAFCTMYRGVPFRPEPLEQIRSDLREAGREVPWVTRVFLESGDAFTLSGERLAAIAELIHRELPQVETIAMYASVLNIANKTDGDLRRLRELGINDLNIGVESGLDEALQQMDKGYSAEEALTQLLRLREAGMDYGANVIFGCAGPELRRENAARTAELLNKTGPSLIFTGTLHADPGCPLYDRIRSGAFRECTVGEYLEEEELFLRSLKVTDCLYFGLHPSNVASLYGRLPGDKERLLGELARRRESLTPAELDRAPVRLDEGAVLL